MSDDITKLYTKNNVGLTPAFYATMPGVEDNNILPFILNLSPIPKTEELLIEYEDASSSELLDVNWQNPLLKRIFLTKNPVILDYFFNDLMKDSNVLQLFEEYLRLSDDENKALLDAVVSSSTRLNISESGSLQQKNCIYDSESGNDQSNDKNIFNPCLIGEMCLAIFNEGRIILVTFIFCRF